jgi:hypothetical protein
MWGDTVKVRLGLRKAWKDKDGYEVRWRTRKNMFQKPDRKVWWLAEVSLTPKMWWKQWRKEKLAVEKRFRN